MKKLPKVLDLMPSQVSLTTAIAIGVLIRVIIPAKVTAQGIPNFPLPSESSPPIPKPLPPLDDLLPQSTVEPTKIQLSPFQVPGRMFVKKFKVIGNTAISAAEIERTVQPYTLRPLSFIQLLEVQRVVTELYHQKGYITSLALIPPQVIQDRIITIKVIEGKLEAIKIRGLKRLNSNYVRSRLALATKAPLNQEKLLNALKLLQLNPLIAHVTAELSAGIEPGSSLLEVKIEEKNNFDAKLSLDNLRNPSIGSQRRKLEISHGNLLGLGDRFLISYINTDGSNSLDDLRYTLPLNAHNSTLEVAHSRTYSQIIEEPFAELDIDTKTSRTELTYRQPLYQTPNIEIAAGLTFSRENSETTLLNRPFPLSRGSNNQGEIKVSALRLFQEYIERDEKQALAIRSQLSIGINAFEPTINNNLPDSRFLAWRGQAQYLKLLTPTIALLLRSDLQLANQALLPMEQFSLGGGLTVRGYRQDALLADNGLFTSAELQTSILTIPQKNITLQLIPFVDFGTVWNRDTVKLDNYSLSSLGIGLRLLVGNNFNLRVDWGIPLVETDLSNTYGENDRINFSLELRPF
jgi:hemolysin activation/secretion protein